MTQIFSDGFESGNFNAWTGTYNSPTVENTSPHHGTYNMQAAISSGTYPIAYQLFSGQATAYARAYVKLSALPSNGNRVNFLTLINSDQTSIGAAYAYNDGGTVKWEVSVKDNGVHTYVQGSSGPVVDTYYCVELYVKVHATAGEATLWINGVQVATVTGKKTDNQGNIGGVAVGEWRNVTVDTITESIDCVVAADAYIGPESTVTLQTVTDSLWVADSFFRHKAVDLADSLGVSDAIKGNKSLLLTDFLNLSASLQILKTLKTLDALTLSDEATTPQRISQITDSVTLVEFVTAGAGAAKKTKLFLILGDLVMEIDKN